MKYLVTTAICILISLACHAQWTDSGAWTNHSGFSTNSYTNFIVLAVEDVWDQSSNTNYIPDVELDLEIPWRPDQGSVAGSTVWNWFDYDDYEGKLPGTTTVNARTFTNNWNAKIAYMPDISVATNWQHAVTNIVFYSTNGTVVTTNDLTRSYTVYLGTNATNSISIPVTFEAERLVDLFKAIEERYRIFDIDPIEAGSAWELQPRGYLDIFHWYNTETLKYLVSQKVSDFIVPMSDYDGWFSTPQGYDAIREESHWEWSDADGDGTNDMWQMSVPTDFPFWTEALVCISNGLPYTITTNEYIAGEDDTFGWYTGETNSYYATSGTVYTVEEYTTEYFDLYPSANYFNLDVDYHPYIQTNSWVFPLFDYASTNSLSLKTMYAPLNDYWYWIEGNADTNSVITNAQLEVWFRTNNVSSYESPISSTNDFELVYSSGWIDYDTNIVYSVTITNTNFDVGFAYSDYTVEGLKDILNDMYIIEADSPDTTTNYYAGQYDWYEMRQRIVTTVSEDFGMAGFYSDWATAKATNELLWANSPDEDQYKLQSYDAAWTNTTPFSNSWSIVDGYGPMAGTQSVNTDDTGGFDGWAEAINQESKYILTNATPYSVSFDIYFLGESIGGLSSAGESPVTEILDIQMTGVTSNYTEYAQHTITATNSYTSGWIGGPQTYTTFPDWVAQATTNDAENGFDYYGRTKGYQVEGNVKAVMRFNVTSGFDYVE